MMLRSKSKTQLGFPVKKSSRSRGQKSLDGSKSSTPRPVCIISNKLGQDACSPPKKTKSSDVSEKSLTKVKRVVHFGNAAQHLENLPPPSSPRLAKIGKTLHSTLSPSSPLSLHNDHVVLSPMRLAKPGITVSSPRRLSRSALEASSPRRLSNLDFPLQLSKSQISSPRRMSKPESSAWPSLNRSTACKLDLPFGPRLSLGNVPLDALAMDDMVSTKRALTFSPKKEMRVNGAESRLSLGSISPTKRLLALHARRQLIEGLSPRKSFGGQPSKSPCKAGGHILDSPKKFGNVLLASPRKGQPPLSPRKLDVRSLTSPMRLAKQEGICYKRAKEALHTAIPSRIVGRDSEKNIIQGFLEKHIKRGGGGNLYISGAPGTGKTAVMSYILQALQERDDCQTVYVNCMNSENPQAIYNKLQTEILSIEVNMSVKNAVKQLDRIFLLGGDPIVVILDEVDQLHNKSLDVLYRIFEWPSLTNSRLILIGIANSLDLTDRILPRLKARCNYAPQLINFPPYTKDQIVAVLNHRLTQVSLEGHVVLDPSAVQFCARKIAATAGDMRRALDTCRRAVESVESEVRKQPIIEQVITEFGNKSPLRRPPVPKKITAAHIMRTLSEVDGNSAISKSAPQTIPLQHKLVICSLLLLVKCGKMKEVTLGKLHETYHKVCAKQRVTSISQSEFQSVCSLIEARGICQVKKAKSTRDAKVSLKLDESELDQAMQDKVLLSSILAEGLP